MSSGIAAKLLPSVEIVDAHAHFGRWEYPGCPQTADEFRRALDRCGFDRVIVSSSVALMYDITEGNAEVAALAEQDERIFGSLVFNGHYPDESRAQIERYAAHPRFVSAKYHGMNGLTPNAPQNLRMIEVLAGQPRRLPLTFHTWSDDGPAATEVAKRFPHVTCFWFHALAANYRKAAELAAELPNVYFDFVTSTQERGKVDHLVAKMGADRLVFGSDQSLLDPIYCLGPILEANLSDVDRRKILAGTAKRVFGLT